jgi:hypothetical protein
MTVANSREVEQERLCRANELLAERGETWTDDYRPGSFGCHELLDRTALLADLLQKQLLDHPACVANPAWYRLAEQAASALHQLYQQIGAEHLGADGPTGQDSKGVPA